MITIRVQIEHTFRGVTDPVTNGKLEEIMATLQEIVAATRRNGEAARGAIARVADDIANMQAQLAALRDQVAAGNTSNAELAALRAGLDEVITQMGATTADLEGFDPDPNHPSVPAPPTEGGGGGEGDTPPTGGAEASRSRR